MTPDPIVRQGRRPGGQPKTRIRVVEVQPEVVRLLMAGTYVANAAHAVGVSPRTMHRWLERGERSIQVIEQALEEGKRPPKRDEPYHTFAVEVTRARADVRTELAKTIGRASMSDWKAAAWLLERGDPENYAPRNRITVGGDDEAPPIAIRAEARVAISDDDRLAQVMEALVLSGAIEVPAGVLVESTEGDER